MNSGSKKNLTNLSARVVISGHADERGTREYNLASGHRRATSVADYMMTNGIDGLRIKKVAFGKEKPLLKAQMKGRGQGTGGLK